jgi:hypothetical protein
MVAFAAEFDPQPFRLSEAAARQSFFGVGFMDRRSGSTATPDAP